MVQTSGKDATSFTARAEGHGLVDWTPERIDAYASGLLRTHLPTRRWVRGRPHACRDCGYAWPCAFVTWAEQWGTNLMRSESRRAGPVSPTNGGG